jgi:hypothetical protein
MVVPGPGQWQVHVQDAANLAPVTINANIWQNGSDLTSALLPSVTSGALSNVLITGFGSTAPYLAIGPPLNIVNYPNTLASFVGTSGSNNYTQVVQQDLNPQGSASFIVGGDNMTNTTHYGDVSFNGSGVARNPNNVFFTNPNSMSLYSTDPELDIAAGLVTGYGTINFYLDSKLIPSAVMDQTKLQVPNIVDNTNYSMNSLGMLNPAAIPVTTKYVSLANQYSLSGDALGQAAAGVMYPVRLTTQYANATATPTTIWSFPVAASTNYHIECEGRYKAAAGGAFELTLTGPVSPTNIGYTFNTEVNLSAGVGTYLDYESGIATTYPTSINAVAVTAAATDMSFAIIVDINNAATAGVLSIQGNTISTNTLNVEVGSTCKIF